MSITTRQEFIDYTFRSLGAPVVQINIDQQQAEDRLDEALDYMNERHYDFNQRALFVHQITDSDIARKYFDTSTFGPALGAQVRTLSDGSTGYWPVAGDILTVNKAFPTGNAVGDYIFDLRYQLTLFDFFGLYMNQSGFSSGPMGAYMEGMSYLKLVNDVFNYPSSFTYTKTTNRLFLDTDYSSLASSQFLLIEAYVKVDPDLYPKIWEDRIFKKYYSAMLKKQWAQNLMKFAGVPLPGGAKLDAPAIMQEAVRELAEIDIVLLKTHELPIDPFIG
jgi:hypothetical protein